MYLLRAEAENVAEPPKSIVQTSAESALSTTNFGAAMPDMPAATPPTSRKP